MVEELHPEDEDNEEEEREGEETLWLSSCIQKTKTTKKKKKKKKEKEREVITEDSSYYYFPFPATTLITEEEDCDEWKAFREEKYNTESMMMIEEEDGIVQGEQLPIDVFTLLSNGGKRDFLVPCHNTSKERVGLLDSSIAAKYLIILCFLVPTHSNDPQARAIISAYPNLKLKDKNVEMVVVAKMRASHDHQLAFDRFMSAFPPSCLAVPYFDSLSRESICKSLGLSLCPYFGGIRCLVLDPHQIVLQTDYSCLEGYGSSSFPFTSDRLLAISTEDDDLQCRLDPIRRELSLDLDADGKSQISKCEAENMWKPLSLEELLCCDSSTLVHKCSSPTASISVSDLCNKTMYVGLYFCYNGKFMSRLNSHLNGREIEIEIILVHVPQFSHQSSYYQAVEQALQKYQITSWWVLPPHLTEPVSLRMFRIGDYQPEDNLFIWGHGSNSPGGEVQGRLMIHRLGSYADEALHQPITKINWVNNWLRRLRLLSLDSFLGDNAPVYTPLLKNRSILLCLARTESHLTESYLFEPLCKSYKQFKEDYPLSEIVFVQMSSDDRDDDDFYNNNNNKRKKKKEEEKEEIPWLRLPTPVTHPEVANIFGIADGYKSALLVALGADNQIKSITFCRDSLKDRLRAKQVFADTLRSDVLDGLLSFLADTEFD